MHIVHFAGAHLGFETAGSPDPVTRLSSRVTDVCNRLDEICAGVESAGADLILFAGDAFKGCKPTPTLAALFAERVRRLAATGAAVVMVAGCQDQPRRAGESGPLAIYDVLGVPGVHVASEPCVLDIATGGGPVAVACLPDGVPADCLADAVQGLATEVGRNGEPERAAVLVAHLELRQTDVGALIHRRFPYVALGHARTPAVLCDDGPFIAYAGALERAGWDEEGEARGYWRVELDAANRLACAPRLLPLAARDYRSVDVAVAPGDIDPTELANEAVRSAALPTGASVRVRITGRREELARLHRADVTADRVDVVVSRPARTRAGAEVTSALTETAALDMWLAANQDLPDRDRIRARGVDLIGDVLGAA